MAPVKPGSADASVSTKGAASQRSIASFFGSKPATQAASTKKSPKKTKETLSIPAAVGQSRSQPSPAKRARLAGVSKNQAADDEKSEFKSSPTSADSTEAGRNGGITKKSKDWVSTPSPSEAAKCVTKTFGRRDRKGLKSGVVAPVLSSSSIDHLPEHSAKSGIAEEGRTPESVVGKRLKVFWPLDQVWYSGRVKSYNKALASHTIKYDDGEEESVVLGKEKVKWLDELAEQGSQSPQAKRMTELRSHGRSNRTNSPPTPKRKKVDEVDEYEDSLLDELKNDEVDEVQSGLSKRGKRARLDVVEDDSPAKVLTVSADVYDDVDIPMPKGKEEVKVRRRLKKKVEEKAPERKNGDVEEIDLVQMEEEDSKARKRVPNRVATSARRLQLDAAADHNDKSPSTNSSAKSEHDPLDESLPHVSGESEIGCKQSSVKKTASAKLGTRDCKTSLDSKRSHAKDFFSRLSVKSAKISPSALPVSSVKPVSLACKDDVCEIPKVLEADKLNRGELHSTLVGEAAERFGGRVEEKFKFLGKGRKDGSGKSPSDRDYDPRSVLLPHDFLKGLSGGQRQWWEFKSKHMDKVLLFKMGKFYELFEMDAHIGAQELDLQYMKGDQPHCGFPEKLYSDNAEKLARKGYRVLVVEQTETPDQLEQRKRDTGTKDKVVRREVCAVLTKGTIVDGEMLLTCPDAAYLMSITEMALTSSELSVAPDNAVTIGICFVDTSTSHIMLGQFIDDAARSRLRSVLSELRPVELIKPRGILTGATERAIKDHTRKPLINSLVPGREFWDAKQSLKEITQVYASFKSPAKLSSGRSSKEVDLTESGPAQLKMLPEVLRHIVDSGSRGEAALSAVGGCLFYLRQALLDQTVLRLGRFDLLPGSDPFSGVDSLASHSEQDQPKEPKQGAGLGSSESESNSEISRKPLEPYLLLDSAALENLEIIENNRDGGPSGTLFAHLDNCVTPYGRRLLKQWLVRPLIRVEPILQRQLALLDLKGVAADAALNFKKELKSQSDMERLLARLHACSGASGRNGDNVVLYEDAAKKQLQEFTGGLRGCRALLQSVKSFEGCLSKLTSDRLRELVTPGLGVPDMTPVIEHFEAAFDIEEAEKTGRILPHEGVDDDFDEAVSAVNTATEKLAEYLVKQRKKFSNSSEINYVTVGKETYQMEIPEKFHSKVPSSYEMRSSRKGFQRYWTPEIKELLQDLTAGEQQRELALRGILQGLVKRFCENCSKWLALVKSVAEVDVLISFSEASAHSAPTCQPTFVTEASSVDAMSFTPKIITKGIRHPTVSVNLAGGGAFVPNDVALGGVAPSFMLLSGPNMGGKSTLIRQVCLAVVLAQIGANVTADQFELSPVDRVFVRMGAKDHIMAGQSTFLVELSETATMLRSATSHSLVALDELGRGTSTSDGQAIAHSVLQHLAHNVGCRGMFSTHYHRLATHFSSDLKVGLYHMSCKVDTGADGLEEVIFLYKLAAGACPKSYGVNVARLAGMPESVLRRAADRAAELESLSGKNANCKSSEGSEDAMASTTAGADDDMSGSEIEIKVVKEVVRLLKKIPIDEASDVGHSDLMQVWQEAKQKLKTSSNCREQPLVAEQKPGLPA